MTQEERSANLKAIEDCGAAEMPIDETCVIAEMSEENFAADEEAQARYRAGHLKTKLAVRQSVVKMAKEGVPQMVKIYLEFNAETATFGDGGSPDLSDLEKVNEE